jgi:hypothetical protein
MLRRYARQRFLFEALTFENRTSIQCNRRAQFKSEDILSIP